MYTSQDLNEAVKEGIFSQESLNRFYDYTAQRRDSPSVDEENFKLISGFNDIFVVIASFLTLISAWWISHSMSALMSTLTLALISWALAEFFVRKRKMSFPAIMLLGVFVSSIFFGLVSILEGEYEVIFASALTALATYAHWRRFHVPITVAFGMVVGIIFVISTLLSLSSSMKDYLAYMILLSGLISFVLAMRWDMKDTKRMSNHSDVAFWLHLLSSPLIVHSVFTLLGIFDSQENGIGTIIMIVILYITLSLISLIIDRRAFMVSSLGYILYAMTTLFKSYGIENNSFAIAGIFIGFALLLLSAYWSKVRTQLLSFLPLALRKRVP